MTDNETTIEERFSALDSIIEEMEGGTASLEDTFSLYRKGIEELQACTAQLATVEQAVQALNAEGALMPFTTEEGDGE